MKKQLNQKILRLLDLKPASKYDILDFGCGSGQLLGAIHDHLHHESRLIGIDSMKNAIEAAKNIFPDINFRQEKFIDILNFPDACFNFVISVDTLECIPNKSSLIAEIHRILKPNGKIICAHWDWDTQVYNSKNKQIMRRFVAEFSDFQQSWMETSDGQIGRKLWGLFQGSQLFKGHMDIFSLIETEFKEGTYGHDRFHDLSNLVAAKKLDMADFQLILNEMETLNKKGEYFYSLNSYIYSGRKA